MNALSSAFEEVTGEESTASEYGTEGEFDFVRPQIGRGVTNQKHRLYQSQPTPLSTQTGKIPAHHTTFSAASTLRLPLSPDFPRPYSPMCTDSGSPEYILTGHHPFSVHTQNSRTRSCPSWSSDTEEQHKQKQVERQIQKGKLGYILNPSPSEEQGVSVCSLCSPVQWKFSQNRNAHH
uniref:Uncharacterized protein n=1 Tax=Percolomonas cosmopolitus TaxID=63605 RepID=A0A7S1KP99_9EUKA|mmetsp:Transcript_3826/g.14505  ORF Transcript_3826/g.14505 Transcript_3826/m.14505 type:complete len:178 (+) Transcript_3826:532-1065(+)